MYNTERKDLILSKTFDLLLHKGYDGVSITDIQQATGMSRGLLYHYFENKEVLFIEVTTKYFIDMFNIDLDTIKSYDTKQMIEYIVEKYKCIISETISRIPSMGNIGIVNYDFLFYRVMQESELFATKYKQVREHELLGWRVVLGNSRINNHIREDIDIDKTAKYFAYLMDGVWMNAITNKSSATLIEDLRNTMIDYLNLIRK